MALVSTTLVMLAALCWGLSGGIGAILMNEGWGAYMVSFYRGLIGLLCMLVWLALRPHGNGLTIRRLWFWSAVAGLGIAGNFAFYFLSIAKGSVAVAATLMYCAPVFVYLISFAFKLEKATRTKWIAIAVVIIGIVLLTRVYDIDTGSITLLGVGAGLLAGLSYAIFIFGFKYATPHGSPQAILAIAFAVPVCILIWPANIHQAIAVLGTPDWSLFIILGILGAGLSFVLYVMGLNNTAPVVAAIVAMVEPVTASLFSVVVLDESLVAPQILGMGLILVTVTTLSAYQNK